MADDPSFSVFRIRADACPSLPNRILGLLAQLGLSPLELVLRRDAEELSIRLVQDAIEPDRAEVVAEKMRAIVTVRLVELTRSHA